MKPLILNACEIYMIGTLKGKVAHYMAGLCMDIWVVLCKDRCLFGYVMHRWICWAMLCMDVSMYFRPLPYYLTRSTKLVGRKGMDTGAYKQTKFFSRWYMIGYAWLDAFCHSVHGYEWIPCVKSTLHPGGYAGICHTVLGWTCWDMLCYAMEGPVPIKHYKKKKGF